MSVQESGRFGTFKGVYIPSILTILGVIMYLRLGWVLGNVGLIGTLAVVTLATSITFLTALSIAATATNMRIGGGGAYYMISRSFGIEAGAAVGLPLYLAQAFGISFYLAGFAESVQNLFPSFSMASIAISSLIVLTVLAYLSADLALKTQSFIFVILVLSLVSFFLGDPDPNVLRVKSSPPPKESFWIVFAVFFPAVTGIEAGISMSGDLKNPARSLPWGTLAAVVTGYVVYMIIPIYLSKMVSDNVLRSNAMIMRDVALFQEAIWIGIWGASLSSALGALLGAPRTLQALARDSVVPKFLGKGFGRDDAPRIATAVSFGVALAGILLGDLDAIAPVLSMFFLTSYGMLNLIAGVESFLQNPSWRPQFKTPWIVSIFGAFACFATMMMINSGATFIAGFLCFLIYYFMTQRKMRAGWFDVRRAMLAFFARYSIYQLSAYEPNPKSWRPNILVLSGSPTARWYLIELADAITHGKGFLTVATILLEESVKEGRTLKIARSMKQFIRKKGVPCLVEVNAAKNFLSGATSLVRSYGLGPIYPNTFVLGETEKEEKYIEYSSLLMLLYASKRNIMIVREGVKPKRKFFGGHGKTIDVWWGRRQQNAGLMLVFAYMLQTSPEWSGCELTLKSLVSNEDERSSAYDYLEKFLSESRIQAGLHVYVGNSEEDRMETIKRYSAGADLVFIGMRKPEQDETAENYSQYYRSLIRRTEGFPSTAIVLAAEDVDFSQIFV